MIQILTHNEKKDDLKGANVHINNFHDALSLDEFNINIIDLRDDDIWKNKANNKETVNAIKDLSSLSVMISESVKSNIIIIYPQNITYYYDRIRISQTTNTYKYIMHSELKNMIDKVNVNILSFLYRPFRKIETFYENTKTIIYDNEILASFAFKNINPTCILTKSFKSNKPTTIKIDNVIITTLNITSYDQLIIFLRGIELIEEKEEVPDWIKNEKMFDDQKQLDLIEEKNKLIDDASKDIKKAEEILSQNEKYKSILYTSGDELVDVVFEILQKMLGCDLSEFNDMKREDFNFKMDDNIFIGEIKGITSNVKSANVTQLEVHVQNYLDDYPEEKDNIISLLIIDHQRNRALFEREEVHETQIRLAERNGSLIVETITLLKMFEKYLNGVLSREKCIEILKNNKGLLSFDMFN